MEIRKCVHKSLESNEVFKANQGVIFGPPVAHVSFMSIYACEYTYKTQSRSLLTAKLIDSYRYMRRP